MIEVAISNEDCVIWQTPDSEENPIPEPAIMVKEYSDILGLVQEGKEILINKNRKNLLEIAKLLKLKADCC
ncbi:MAG: hypothetical protein ACI9DH_000542 [Halioglobus sp.]|jgi:hypothetical protein